MKKRSEKNGSKKRIALGVAGAAGAFVLGASLFTAVPAVAGGFGLGPADGTGNNATTQAAGKAETSVPRAASDRACPGYWDTDGDGICDNYGTGAGGGYGYGAGNGVCDGTGQGYGYGTGNGSGQGYGYGAASGGHHGNGGGHHGRC